MAQFTFGLKQIRKSKHSTGQALIGAIPVFITLTQGRFKEAIAPSPGILQPLQNTSLGPPFQVSTWPCIGLIPNCCIGRSSNFGSFSNSATRWLCLYCLRGREQIKTTKLSSSRRKVSLFDEDSCTLVV